MSQDKNQRGDDDEPGGEHADEAELIAPLLGFYHVFHLDAAGTAPQVSRRGCYSGTWKRQSSAGDWESLGSKIDNSAPQGRDQPIHVFHVVHGIVGAVFKIVQYGLLFLQLRVDRETCRDRDELPAQPCWRERWVAQNTGAKWTRTKGIPMAPSFETD